MQLLTGLPSIFVLITYCCVMLVILFCIEDVFVCCFDSDIWTFLTWWEMMMKKNFQRDLARYLFYEWPSITSVCKLPSVNVLHKQVNTNLLFLFSLLQPYIDLRSATCMFDVLRRKLSTSSAYPHLLSILHHMLLIPSE